MEGPKKLIHPFKKKAAGNVLKMIKIDVLSLDFGTFIEGSETLDPSSTFTYMGLLLRGPLHSFIYGMDTQIQKLLASFLMILERAPLFIHMG